MTYSNPRVASWSPISLLRRKTEAIAAVAVLPLYGRATPPVVQKEDKEPLLVADAVAQHIGIADVLHPYTSLSHVPVKEPYIGGVMAN
jgi:hypothetical protein